MIVRQKITKLEGMMDKIPELKEKTNILGSIANFFIARYRVVYLIVFAILVLGYTTYVNMSRELIPEVSMNMVMVTTSYPGASAEDIENLITNPIEDAISSVDELKEIKSTSNNGVSSIHLAFEESADIKDALADVNEKINKVKLPDDATDPYVVNFKTSDMPVLQMVVTGDYDLTDLKTYGENLKSKIEGVSGIAEVDLTGGYNREIKVLISSTDLLSYNLSVNDISNALRNTNIAIPSGTEEIDEENYSISIDESFSEVRDIENTVVRSDSKGIIYIKDVATVIDSYKEPSSYSYQYIRGDKKMSTPAVYLSVYRENGYDMVGPSEEVRKIIAEGSPELFPEDVTILMTKDRSVKVEVELDQVLSNAISGFLVVIIVLFLFIGLHESLIVATVMPLSLFIAVYLLDVSGKTLNTLSLTGFIIALGLIVDNAIVVMENVDRMREKGLDKVTASRVGTNQVGPAILAATLTTVAAFLPLVLMAGSIGSMINVLPLTVIFTIIASLIMSLSVTPTFCAMFLPKFKNNNKLKGINVILSVAFIVTLSLIAFMDEGKISLLSIVAAILFGGAMVLKGLYKLKYQDSSVKPKLMVDRYSEWIGRVLQSARKRWMIFITATIVLILCLVSVAAGAIKLEVFPVEEPDTITINVEGPQGYLLDDMDKIIKEIENKLYEYEDIKSFNASIGNNSANKGKITVELVDTEIRDISAFDLLTMMREDVKYIAGVNIIVEANLSMGPSSNDIEVILKGDNYENLELLGSQYQEVLNSIPGVINLGLDSMNGMKNLTIKVDNQKAAMHRLTPASISNIVSQRISGVKAGVLKDNSEEFDITLYIDENKIRSVKDFGRIYFPAPDGTLVNFYDVATLESSQGVSTISHIDGTRVLKLVADVDPDYNVKDIMNEFEDNIKSIRIPNGVTRALGGGFADLNETVVNMIVGYLAAILLVYIILVIQFNSLLQPVVILISVPLALIGVIIGLVITGNNLGIYAMMGVIALVGIAVNDAIVLIDYTNYLRCSGYNNFDSIVEAVKTRFAPVMATSITTIGGVLPLAIKSSSYGQLGYALIFGLVASTLLTLLIIPIVLYTMDKGNEKIKGLKLFRRSQDEENN